MTKTEILFKKGIRKAAELVKYLNEDVEVPDENQVDELNEEIAEYETELGSMPMDFPLEDVDVKEVMGDDYFIDRRCWDYLSDMVSEMYDSIDWDHKHSSIDYDE